MDDRAGQSARTTLEAAIAYARRNPGSLLAIVLCLHLLVWTLLPLLLTHNLQLDLVEDLAFGKEWQLGYWKHPPLPWWLADLVYRLTGSVNTIYLLGPLAAVTGMVGVWLLAREVAGKLEALIAVLALEGIHFYNFSVVKFAHDQMQLPFWAFTGLFFYRAIARGRLLDWALAGAFLAGAFWSKYAAVVLAATLGLFLLLDPVARRAWRTPGPYIMALTFVTMIAPNAWWLVANDFLPFHYADERARAAARWYQYLVYPLQWTGSQALALLPAGALLALLYRRGDTHIRPAEGESAAFNRRYVTTLALGPFLVTTVIATAFGRLAIAMWGYPLWSFAPLAVLLWIGPVGAARELRRFAGGFMGVVIAIPMLYAAAEIIEPFLRDRPKATQFPGRTVAETITRAWREAYGTPLTYVGGTEFTTNIVAVYSPDRPHAIPHGNLKLAPWIDRDDLRRRGAVLVWEEGNDLAQIDVWARTFSNFEVQPVLVVARLTWHPVEPARVMYALIPPRP